MNNSKSNQELETILELKERELSEKLNKYIEKVKKETGRHVKIKGVQDVEMLGACERFIVDCNSKYLLVEIIEDCYCVPKENINQEEVDRAIAHEVTHGLLAYKEKYCQFEYIRRPIEEELLNSTSMLFTMIEDIVVNKRIDKNNFKPISQVYIDTIKKVTEDIQKGKDIFRMFDNAPIFKKSFMVLKCIQPWGYLRYFNLDKIDKKTLRKFLELFQESYFTQYQGAKIIQETISKNDIFTREGFDKTIRECLNLWNLADLVKLYTC